MECPHRFIWVDYLTKVEATFDRERLELGWEHSPESSSVVGILLTVCAERGKDNLPQETRNQVLEYL